jgi:SNF2 family DNA or RNA helicase
MERTGWQIKNGILSLNGESEIFIPDANEIYSAVFETAREGSPFDSRAVEYFEKEVSFSRYPVDVNIELLVRQGAPVCSVQVRKNASIVDLSFDQHIPDHIVIENVWYPFVPGILDQIRDLLSSNGINAPGVIGFGEYLRLAKLARENNLIINNAIDENIVPENLIDYSDNTPPVLKAKLYPYQRDGWNWLRFMAREKIGGILADEMGLGKTLQLIALFASESPDEVFPSLVIAPSTLLENWRREISRFAPHINCIVHQGGNRTGFPRELKKFNITITSYDTAVRDNSLFGQVDWKIMICDEAQAIKNPETRRAIGIKKISRKTGFAVTGTPVENRLQDLWSIMDFAVPQYLDNKNDFERKYEKNPDGAVMLEKVISPLILRRRVSDVAKDLPARIDIPQAIEMGSSEISEYERVRRETLSEFSSNASLVVLVRLRMFCTHPFLLNDRTGDNPEDYSSKYQRLIEISDEIVQNGAKMLVFTSFNRMSDLIVSDFVRRFGIYVSFIDGRTPVPDRQKIVDEFSAIEGPAVLILNPRAAGTGLNITAANHIIHYNLEWNPAVEDQASARAYRRGQDRPVTIHRLFYCDTVEEAIDERLQRKRQIAGTAVVGVEGKEDDYHDILNALKKTPER